MKRFVIISAIFISAVFRASALDVSITVPVAGSLPYVLKQQYDWEKVTSLTVYGEINGDDCEFLRIMAGGKKAHPRKLLNITTVQKKAPCKYSTLAMPQWWVTAVPFMIQNLQNSRIL